MFVFFFSIQYIDCVEMCLCLVLSSSCSDMSISLAGLLCRKFHIGVYRSCLVLDISCFLYAYRYLTFLSVSSWHLVHLVLVLACLGLIVVLRMRMSRAATATLQLRLRCHKRIPARSSGGLGSHIAQQVTRVALGQ